MDKTYFVYVLASQTAKRLCAGMSADAGRRLEDHNAGRVFSTKGNRPWRMVRVEQIGPRPLARIREKELRSGSGKEMLRRLYIG